MKTLPRSGFQRFFIDSTADSVSLLIGVCVVGICAAWPAIAMMLASIAPSAALPASVPASDPASDPASISTSLASSAFIEPSAIALLARSVSYAFIIALLGTLLAWSASRVYRRAALTRTRVLLAAFIVLPLALPPWLLYAAMWLTAGPGSTLGDFAERSDSVAFMRQAALVISLVIWSSAPAFALLMLSANAARNTSARLLQLDGASLHKRLRAALACDGRALCASVALLSIFLLGETTAFDLAQVTTYGFELRTQDALGATPAQLLEIAWPALLLAILAAAAMPWLAARAGVAAQRSRATNTPLRVGLSWHDWPLACAASGSIALVLLFLSALMQTSRAGDFVALHADALVTQLTICACAAAIVALFAASMRVAIHAPTRAVRFTAHILLACAALAAFVPGTVAAVALVCAFNRESTSALYDSLWIEVIALTQRTLLVAAVVVFTLSAYEHSAATRLRALDGTSLLARVRGMRREVLIAASVTALMSFALALGELTVSGRVAPPGVAWLASDIMNAIHYQRPETVLLSALALVLVALPAAWVSITFIATLRAARATTLALFCCVFVSVGLPSCSNSSPQDLLPPEPIGFDRGAPLVAQPLATEFMLSGVGRGRGQFNGPRVVACDSVKRETYVIDKDARVQRFAEDGTVLAEWTMPKSDRGRPVGATVAPDGSLVVIDTHEHRVLCFTPNGEQLWELGSYGHEVGQFIYPTDVAFAPDGRMFVGEYGGNDRIQVFGPDRTFLYAFGKNGSADGELLRPQALAYDAARDELYVADASNHRIEVFTGDGEFRRAFGGPGRAEGAFMYPFGLVLEIAGVPVTSRSTDDAPTPDTRERTVLVAEHCNHRIQRLDGVTGAVRNVVGGIGRAAGQLKYPWAIEPAWIGDDGVWRYAVCDHANSRIQFFVLPVGSERAVNIRDAI